MVFSPHLKEKLDKWVDAYNNVSFIVDDPISIPHSFKRKEDIEISAFLSATIAWGNRKMIIKNAQKIMHLMDNQPYEFIMKHKPSDLKKMQGFVHRTFNDSDLLFFIYSLQNLYKNQNGLESVFTKGYETYGNIADSISYFRSIFLEALHENRSEKHISNTQKKSAAKRLNMFLRWMVRHDNKGVDFGLWKNIPCSELLIPLDVHTATVARKLGLLLRKQNDLPSVLELTHNLKQFNPQDPVIYDFALFGAGVNKQI